MVLVSPAHKHHCRSRCRRQEVIWQSCLLMGTCLYYGFIVEGMSLVVVLHCYSSGRSPCQSVNCPILVQHMWLCCSLCRIMAVYFQNCSTLHSCAACAAVLSCSSLQFLAAEEASVRVTSQLCSCCPDSAG